MKTLYARYKGNRMLELFENVDLPENSDVLVLIPEGDNERILCEQLRSAAESVFSKLWENEEDGVWSEYL